MLPTQYKYFIFMLPIFVWLEHLVHNFPDSKVYGANMGPTWVLLAPDGPHNGLVNLAIGVSKFNNVSREIVVLAAYSILESDQKLDLRARQIRPQPAKYIQSQWQKMRLPVIWQAYLIHIAKILCLLSYFVVTRWSEKHDFVNLCICFFVKVWD